MSCAMTAISSQLSFMVIQVFRFFVCQKLKDTDVNTKIQSHKCCLYAAEAECLNISI